MLRFLAAFGVVLHHSSFYVGTTRPDAGPFVEFFFQHHFGWGVRLFFVISGFVIAQSIERMPVGEFARRRLLRIYPAYWVAVALVVGMQVVLWGQVPGAGDIARAVTLLPFGPIQYPLAVEWSLVYEIFFYLVVGVAALAGWSRVRDLLCVAWLALIAIGCIVAPSKATAMLPTADQVAFSAFNLPFIIGMLVCRVHLRLSVAWRTYALLSAPALVMSAFFAASVEARQLLTGLGFGALVLWAVLADRHRRLAPGNVLVALGDWSYGLYLVHVPVITTLLALGVWPRMPNGFLFVALAATAIALGSAFGAVEAAVYRWLLRITRRARAPAAPKATVA